MKLDQIWGGFFAGFLRWVYPKKQQVFWVSTRVSEPCRMDERLSWHSWLTYSRHFTHISGQLQIELMTGKVPRSKTDVLPLSATNQQYCSLSESDHVAGRTSEYLTTNQLYVIRALPSRCQLHCCRAYMYMGLHHATMTCVKPHTSKCR